MSKEEGLVPPVLGRTLECLPPIEYEVGELHELPAGFPSSSKALQSVSSHAFQILQSVETDTLKGEKLGFCSALEASSPHLTFHRARGWWGTTVRVSSLLFPSLLRSLRRGFVAY